ncbi:sulfate transporter-like [Saccostrea echinata]|uniref:sulfate transporter-like n=1 Tax=Saccostrea echinata TaxID=191078 RepID=UPI002A841DE1|nr:sulfate transporter-like [Saccostrea echinata]
MTEIQDKEDGSLEKNTTIQCLDDLTEHMTLIRHPKTQGTLDDVTEKKYDDNKCGNIENCTCTRANSLNYLLVLFPIIGVLRRYNVKEYLLKDVVSGLSNACLHFPQGMAFGILSSLAPKYGLYTSFYPVVLYVIFGTCPSVSFGTNAVIALFTANLVQSHVTLPPWSGGSTNNSNNSTESGRINDEEFLEAKAAVAAGSSFIVGVLLLAWGLLRFGFIASYMSTPFIGSFTTTATIHIITSQIPKSIGVRIPSVSGPGKLVKVFIEIFKNITTANVGSIITSIICIITLVFFKDFINEKFKSKLYMPIPIDLILVICGTIVSYFGNLKSKFSIPVVGEISLGIPPPTLPDIRTGIIGDSVVVAIIVFVLTISMAKVCDTKNTINADQELVAYGMSNFGGSFFRCFPSCVAPPRTILLNTMGAKTTLNGLFSALVILLILLFLGEYFQYLPIPVLSIMVIMAVKNLLLQFRQLPRLWKINKYDFTVWVATVISGVFIDFPYALYCGIGLSIFLVVFQSQKGKVGLFGKLANEELYVEESKNTVLPSNVKIFKMESSLFFATAESFRENLYKLAGDPRTVKKDSEEVSISVDERPSRDSKVNETASSDTLEYKPCKGDNNTETKYVIIDCSSFNYVDSNGVSIMSLVVMEYRAVGIKVLLVRCTTSFLGVMMRSELMKTVGEENVFPDIVDAINLAVSDE